MTLALVGIAVVPLLAFAPTNIGLQRIVPDDHAALGHYGFMAAFSFTVIGGTSWQACGPTAGGSRRGSPASSQPSSISPRRCTRTSHRG